MQEGLVEVEGSSYQLQPTTGRCWSTQQGVIRSAQEDKRSCFHHRYQTHSMYATWNGSGVQPLVHWSVSGWIQIRWRNYINKWTLGEDVCPWMRYFNIFLCIKLHDIFWERAEYVSPLSMLLIFFSFIRLAFALNWSFRNIFSSLGLRLPEVTGSLSSQ